METEVAMMRFRTAETVVLSQDIADPDAFLDEVLTKLGDDPEQRERLETIKSLHHEEKVAWILGLETIDESSQRLEPVSGCLVFALVSVVFVVMVIVGWIIYEGGKKPIIERQEQLKEIKKCIKPVKPG